MVADSAYKTPWICKCIFESGRILSTCYTRPKTKENGHPWWAYVYDEYFDDVICPEYRACLLYTSTEYSDQDSQQNDDGANDCRCIPAVMIKELRFHELVKTALFFCIVDLFHCITSIRSWDQPAYK